VVDWGEREEARESGAERRTTRREPDCVCFRSGAREGGKRRRCFLWGGQMDRVSKLWCDAHDVLGERLEWLI